MTTGIIYMHTFPDGQRYIGQTTQSACKRFRNGNGYRGCTDIEKAIDQYSWDNVQTDILYYDIPSDELYRYETLCIARWGTFHNGLNSRFGSGVASDEARAKMSAAMKGKKKSDEHCAKMSEAMKGENHPNHWKNRHKRSGVYQESLWGE